MKETDKIYPADKGEEEPLHNVRHILQEARAKVIHHVNSTLVRAYWQVGKYIVEYEQRGNRPCRIWQGCHQHPFQAARGGVRKRVHGHQPAVHEAVLPVLPEISHAV
ncbi:DUF1016 N-terminal domain-containing protein [Bacteroides thetaiotaomicron]|nr:DUF1016 N-terminal domain-containing protein [Bacteroides thetaiotaomicron]